MIKRHLPTLLLALAAGSVFAAPPATTQDTQADLNRKMQQLQQQMSDLSERMGKLATQMGDNARATVFSYIADPGRGTIGLAMRPVPTGEEIVALSPGAPAERAGLQVGDIVTSVDGRPAAGNNEEIEALLAHSEIGKPVKIELLRNDKTLAMSIVPQRRQPADWQKILHATRIDIPDDVVIERNTPQGMAAAGKMLLHQPYRDAARFHGIADLRPVFAPWWGLNLASLNPDLGGYFGITQGALVLSSDSNNYPGLKAGDVITAVDGKTIEQPEDVMRALRDRHADTPAHLALRRHGKTVNVDLKAPPLDALLPPEPPAAPPPPPVPPQPMPPAPPPAPGNGTAL